MDADSTAVVFIEFQNDFTSEVGVLHGAVKAFMDTNGTLDNAEKVLAAATAFVQGAWGTEIMDRFAPGESEIIIEGKH